MLQLQNNGNGKQNSLMCYNKSKCFVTLGAKTVHSSSLKE